MEDKQLIEDAYGDAVKRAFETFRGAFALADSPTEKKAAGARFEIAVKNAKDAKKAAFKILGIE
jgi:hypothetical protein